MDAYFKKIDGEDSACPECGKSGIEWRLAGDPATRVGYAILWCAHCYKGSRLSRVRFPEHIAFVSMFDARAVVDGIPDIEFVG